MFPCDVEITDFRLHTASGAPMLTLSFCADGKAQTLRFLSISDVTLRFPPSVQICASRFATTARTAGMPTSATKSATSRTARCTSSAAKSRPKTANRCRDAGKMENERPCRSEKFRQGDFYAKVF